MGSDEPCWRCDTCGFIGGMRDDECWRCPKPMKAERLQYKGRRFKVRDRVKAHGDVLYSGDTGAICAFHKNVLHVLVKVFWDHRNYTWIHIDNIKHVAK